MTYDRRLRGKRKKSIMKDSLLVLCVLATLLVLVGCSIHPVSNQPSQTTSEQVDLKVGTIHLLPGFSEKRTGTIDSRMGEIVRKEPRFVITYDIGFSSGLHMHPKKAAECLWFKEQMSAGQKCYIGMKKKGADKILTISIVPDGGAGQIGSPLTYPANFWATVKTEEDIADLTQIAMSYVPKTEKRTADLTSVVFRIVSEQDQSPLSHRELLVFDGRPEDVVFEFVKTKASIQEHYLGSVTTDANGGFTLDLSDSSVTEIVVQPGPPYDIVRFERSSDIAHTKSLYHVRMVRFVKETRQVSRNDIYDIKRQMVKQIGLNKSEVEMPSQELLLIAQVREH